MTVALIRKADNQLECFTETTEGADLELYEVIPVDGPWLHLRWNGSSLVPRDPSPSEETHAALESDPRWLALRGASPAQVQEWLASNVTDLASARRVLAFLVLAVQFLARTR